MRCIARSVDFFSGQNGCEATDSRRALVAPSAMALTSPTFARLSSAGQMVSPLTSDSAEYGGAMLCWTGILSLFLLLL